MNTKLFISNLPYEYTSEDLDQALDQLGHKASSVKVITDRESGRSRGFAFAEFGTIAAATAAKDALNGQPLGERARAMSVDFAKEERRGGGGGGRGAGGGGGGGGGGRGRDGGGRGGRGGRDGGDERW